LGGMVEQRLGRHYQIVYRGWESSWDCSKGATIE
jgi:hypothetical protein